MSKNFTGSKCPTCGTKFIEDMCPTAVAFREGQRMRRSFAAKRGWRKRRSEAQKALIGRVKF